jgi:hypothetical protein
LNLPVKKKILVVAESIDIEDSSGTKGRVALIKNLHKAGFEVLVYHYTRKEIQLPGITCIAIKEKRFSFLYYLSRLQRRLQHGFKINLSKYLEPVFGFSFTFFNDANSIAESLKSLKNFKLDLVLTLSKGASFRPHYAMLKLPKLHSKWMAYIHDPYPFHYYPDPYRWSEPGYKHKIDFFKKVSQKSRWAAFPSLLLQEWMQGYFSDFKGKSIVIPHQLVRGKIITQELPDYFDSNKFTLLHAGNLMGTRPPHALINAFRNFMVENPNAKTNSQLILLGQNSNYFQDLQKYKSEVEQLYVSDGYVEYEQVQLMQQNASVNIILESIAEISPFLPGKFPHCVAANKPILLLAPKKSEVRRLLGEDYPYYTEVDKEDSIQKIIEELYKRWEKDPNEHRLNRPDLVDYLSENQLKLKLNKILS